MPKTRFFAECQTIQQLKTKYRELIKVNHPDHGGNEETCKQINLEYETMFQYILDHPSSEQEKKSNYFANVNDGFREILAKVVFIPEIEIEICGSWVWINGNTKPVKDIIKAAGFWWSSNKFAWYWKPANYKGHKHKTWDMDKIRDTYGSQRVANEEREKVSA